MKFEFSAGGVVFKKDSDLKILIAKHSGHQGWVFPKGLIGDRDDNKHEGKEETAIREVKEETGIDGKIIETLTPVTYWYEWKGEKRKKTVYYFVMEYVGGDTSVHDHEMDEVIWISLEEVEKKLTYPSDKKVWKEARKYIK